jgi:hypothetical protein
MESLPCSLVTVSVQNKAGSAIVAFARECGALLENSPDVFNITWFSNEAHLRLNDYNTIKVSDFGSNRIQCLPLPIHRIHKEL